MKDLVIILVLVVAMALTVGVVIGRRGGRASARIALRSTADGGSGEASAVLTACGENKIQVIKQLREVRPDLGLAQAKAFVENPPGVIAQGLSAQRASYLQRAFAAVGAQVEVRGATPTGPDVEVPQIVS